MISSIEKLKKICAYNEKHYNKMVELMELYYPLLLEYYEEGKAVYSIVSQNVNEYINILGLVKKNKMNYYDLMQKSDSLFPKEINGYRRITLNDRLSTIYHIKMSDNKFLNFCYVKRYQLNNLNLYIIVTFLDVTALGLTFSNDYICVSINSNENDGASVKRMRNVMWMIIPHEMYHAVQFDDIDYIGYDSSNQEEDKKIKDVHMQNVIKILNAQVENDTWLAHTLYSIGKFFEIHYSEIKEFLEDEVLFQEEIKYKVISTIRLNMISNFILEKLYDQDKNNYFDYLLNDNLMLDYYNNNPDNLDNKYLQDIRYSHSILSMDYRFNVNRIVREFLEKQGYTFIVERKSLTILDKMKLRIRNLGRKN